MELSPAGKISAFSLAAGRGQSRREGSRKIFIKIPAKRRRRQEFLDGIGGGGSGEFL